MFINLIMNYGGLCACLEVYIDCRGNYVRVW